MRYLYIAGKWTDAADGATSQTINPYDATVLGIGRELGPSGLEEYQEKKHIYHNTSPAPAHWFSG